MPAAVRSVRAELFVCLFLWAFVSSAAAYEPGERAILSAHNCYPYHGLWSDRIDRALATGTPLAIEQDLCWVAAEGGGGESRSAVAHSGPFDGSEPGLDGYFFERVRPLVEAAFAREAEEPGERDRWPLVVLDLDFKDNDLGHVRAVDALLRRYEPWLTWAERGEALGERRPLVPGPVMVLAGGHRNHRRVFHDDVAVGGRVIAFGRCAVAGPDTDGLSGAEKAKARVMLPASAMVDRPADNYHRWWNNSWHAVEAGGAPHGGAWTDADAARLRELVDHAHTLGYFIRFYTVNGHSQAESAVGGYSPGYNTGSREAAGERWRAMLDAGVDFIATDQYLLFDETRRVQPESAAIPETPTGD